MSGQTLKKTVEAAPWDFKFETSVAKDASGKPRVQIKTLLPVGLARGTAPVHPWAKGGLNFWLPEAFRMRHFILGFGTIGILYWRLTQGTVGLREKSKYWNSNILGVHRSHASHH